MAEKVNKSDPFPYKLLCILFVLSPRAEKGGNIAVYDFITQYAIYFMG